jgi:hypothetical protein
MKRKSRSKVEEDRAGFSGPVDSPPAPADEVWGDDWVHKLIAMTRPGVEIEFPSRTLSERPIPFEYDDFS